MLTYKLQDRVYRIKSGVQFSFPNDVEIQLSLAPREAFGMESGQLNFMLDGRDISMYLNANTGRWRFLCKPPLKPLSHEFKWKNEINVSLSGNHIVVVQSIKNFKKLDELVISLHYLIPMLLALYYPEAPYVERTSGKVGDVEFGWEMQHAASFKRKVNCDDLVGYIELCFTNLPFFEDLRYIRFAAALHYYHVTRRLVVTGNSPYEFMAEIILNLNKILEVLFGPRRDSVREELKKLGYSSEDIEIRFIPLMILRNEFDVGHAFLSVIDTDVLKELYSYLNFLEEDFCELLQRILRRMNDGSYVFDELHDLSIKQKKKKIIDSLLISFRKRSRSDLKKYPNRLYEIVGNMQANIS